MNAPITIATFLNGLVLGWSVAWPPGPINAEMIRRGLLPKAEGGGFWSAWRVGLGACTGDFLWALGVSAGAGSVINTPTVRMILGAISFALLLILAFVFARGAWRTACQLRTESLQSAETGSAPRSMSRGYFLGLAFALTSPWNIGFWLAAIGSQAGTLTGSLLSSLCLAGAVLLGAIIWGGVLCVMLKLGARIFMQPAWRVATEALTAIVMLYFAAQLALQLH